MCSSDLSLATLDLKEVALDPFTGTEFRYTVLGNNFTLESAGAYKRTEGGEQDRSTRTSFSLNGTLRQ